MFIQRLVFLTILTAFFTTTLVAQTSLMTYNIRYNTPNDGDNWWEHRKTEVVALIKRYQPDILGLQEGLHGQVEFLDKEMENYQYIGVGRDDGQQQGEYTAIFYNNNTCKLIDNYTYWLSETPEKVSVGWDAALPRITTYGQFVYRATGDTLHVFNCHYDHRGQLARENASKLIRQIINEKGLSTKYLVVMGDLNAKPEEKPLTVFTEMLQDSYGQVSKPIGPAGTFNNFDPSHQLNDRIDYILLGNLRATTYRAVDDKRTNGLYPADHFPVWVTVNFE